MRLSVSSFRVNAHSCCPFLSEMDPLDAVAIVRIEGDADARMRASCSILPRNAPLLQEALSARHRTGAKMVAHALYTRTRMCC